MRERHVTCSLTIQLPQHVQRVLDGMAAFDPDHRSNLAGAANPINIIGRQSKFKSLRVALAHRFDDFDLLQRRAQCRAVIRR